MAMHHTPTQYVSTAHGKIAVQTKGNGLPLLFLHGNSACRRVFDKQFHSPLFDGYQLISFDLPGHGESDDASEPDNSYVLPGLASLALELLDQLRVTRAVLFGASLGGHIAIEMLARSTVPAGLFLVGTPPVGQSMAEGFIGRPLNGLASQAQLSTEEAQYFARAVFGAGYEPFMQQAIARTDAAFRPALFEGARRGLGANQRDIVSLKPVPIAIANGANDGIVNLDYIDSVPYANLWRGQCARIPGATHSPFWEVPDQFNALLAGFMADFAAMPG